VKDKGWIKGEGNRSLQKKEEKTWNAPEIKEVGKGWREWGGRRKGVEKIPKERKFLRGEVEKDNRILSGQNLTTHSKTRKTRGRGKRGGEVGKQE